MRAIGQQFNASLRDPSLPSVVVAALVALASSNSPAEAWR